MRLNSTIRVILSTAIVLTCTGILSACRPSAPAAVADEPSDERPLRIVATIRPLELIVRELLDDPSLHGRYEIATILAPEVSPHGFEPSARQVARLNRADIVIYNGLGLDDWAGRGLPARTRIVRFEDAVDIEAEHARLHHDHDDDHEHGPECNHGPIDEHFWVDPSLVAEIAILIAREIGAALAREGEDSMEIMDQALAQFLARVDDIDEDLAELFSPYKGQRIVTHHNVFPRLAERYGLSQPIVLRPLAVLEPTPGDLRRAIEAIRDEDIRAILVEPQFSAAAAERVRDETGVALVEVDPLGAEAKNWSDLMRRISEAIVASLRE